jgi:hypothetical protein
VTALFLAKMQVEECTLKETTAQIQTKCEIRAVLWREFVGNYQTFLEQSPEIFSAYCEKFRVLWIAGSKP